MKKLTLTIILIMVLIVFVSGGIYYFSSTSLKNCGNDSTCFTESLRSCVKAKSTPVLSNSARENYIEIRGLENKECKVYVKNQENKEMVCLIPYQLYEGYTDWGGYNVLIDQIGIRASALPLCTGSLKEILDTKVADIVRQNPSTQLDKMEISF